MTVKMIPPREAADDFETKEYDDVFHIQDQAGLLVLWRKGGVKTRVRGGWRLEITQEGNNA